MTRPGAGGRGRMPIVAGEQAAQAGPLHRRSRMLRGLALLLERKRPYTGPPLANHWETGIVMDGLPLPDQAGQIYRGRLKVTDDINGRIDLSRPTGIGALNETSLHRSIKRWYVLPGDVLEAAIDGYVVDIARGGQLIEIQTGSFSSVAGKLRDLVQRHPVLLVYPIAKEKWIVKVPERGGPPLSRRRSPKKGTVVDLFDELVSLPDLVREANFSLEVILTREEETRCPDGKGSWRRRGVSILDRRLIGIVESVRYNDLKDFLWFLPDDLPQPFTNRDLAEAAAISIPKARKVTYCLRRMRAIRQIGKRGRELLFELILRASGQKGGVLAASYQPQ